MRTRKSAAEDVRVEAARMAATRPHARHQHNGEEHELRDHGSPPACPQTMIANFTKGLPHDVHTGLLANSVDYARFVHSIQTGAPSDFHRTPLGPGKQPPADAASPSVELITEASTAAQRSKVWRSNAAKDHSAKVRAWESAGAGNVFDLEGPDAQAVTMPPAPRFDSEELVAEIAEVYAMALIRDVSFRDFAMGLGSSEKQRSKDTTKGEACGKSDFDDAVEFLGQLPWFCDHSLETDAHAATRRRSIDAVRAFRGTARGELIGPYLSQFLLLGNNPVGGASAVGSAPEGAINYGAIRVDQRVRVATPCKDYLTAWEPFVDVQNGADLRETESYVDTKGGAYRFIATPRDLATYVHLDALYEAYLNACLFLLASKAPFDRGIPYLEADVSDKQQGFAHFGGPHVLTLVTEVATRALKAVRYQKFNVHRRLRPEAMGGRLDRWFNKKALRKGPLAPFRNVAEGIDGLKWGGSSFLDVLTEHNKRNNQHAPQEPSKKKESYLLPMAFPEGSPMHPSYGAGHATVAGACVTILKAYFDHGWTPPEWFDGKKPIAYESSRDGSKLLRVELDAPLTLEGELNKLAANISIGRNWAGVHYYSDYIESIRMGEEIAVGLLEEQKLTYPEAFSMTVPLFEGGSVRI